MLITVRPRSRTTNEPYQWINGYEVPKAEKREPLKAFCENHKTGKLYRVPGIYSYALEVKVGRGESICPKCGYAIFWSRQYKEKGEV